MKNSGNCMLNLASVVPDISIIRMDRQTDGQGQNASAIDSDKEYMVGNASFYMLHTFQRI